MDRVVYQGERWLFMFRTALHGTWNQNTSILRLPLPFIPVFFNIIFWNTAKVNGSIVCQLCLSKLQGFLVYKHQLFPTVAVLAALTLSADGYLDADILLREVNLLGAISLRKRSQLRCRCSVVRSYEASRTPFAYKCAQRRILFLRSLWWWGFANDVFIAPINIDLLHHHYGMQGAGGCVGQERPLLSVFNADPWHS